MDRRPVNCTRDGWQLRRAGYVDSHVDPREPRLCCVAARFQSRTDRSSFHYAFDSLETRPHQVAKVAGVLLGRDYLAVPIGHLPKRAAMMERSRPETRHVRLAMELEGSANHAAHTDLRY